MSYLVVSQDYLASIVIPVFNTPTALLQRCVAPFLEKKYENIEIIFSDDGSTTQTLSQLRRFVHDSKTPMRLLVAPSNGGQNFARNRGIAASRGRYVIFLDSDDFFDEQEFSEVLHAMRDIVSNSVRIPDIFVYGCKRLDGRSGCVIDGYSPAEKETGVVPASLVIRNAAELWGCVIRRDLLLKEPLYTGISVGEDLVSLIPIIAKATLIVALPISPYRYVQQEESVMHSASAVERMQIVPAFQAMLGRLGTDALSEFHSELEWQAIWHILFWEPLHVLQSAEEPDYSLLDNAQHWMEEHFPNWRKNQYLSTDPKARGLSFRIIVSGHFRFYRLLYRVRHNSL